MLELTEEEINELVSQTVIPSKSFFGGAKPYTFTEHGIADIKKHNDQYEPIELKIFSKAHDRFLIIDENIIYHIGASLKDLGKKWFAFSIIEKDAVAILERISKVRN